MSESPTIAALDCGWLVTQERTLLSGGGRNLLRLPIPAWLIRHPRGDVVFDAGLHPGLADGPDGLGPMAKLFTPDLAPGGSLGPRLAEHDVDPDGPLTVVLSHTHFDHVGGLCEVPNARVLVHGDEWSWAMTDDQRDADRALYDLGHDVLTVDGPHDVFGDGSVVTIPTPGHTCGHQSLRVETAGGATVLAADACYFTHTLDDEVLPPFAFDAEQQLRSLALLRRERDAGAQVVPGHDAAVFEAWLARS